MQVMQLAEKPLIIVRCVSSGKPAVLSRCQALFSPTAMHSAAPMPSATAAPLAVLDTNVVLDLWLFNDPRVAPLRDALQSGDLGVLVTAPMLAELAGVLQRPFATACPVPGATVLAALHALGSLVETPAGPNPAPACTDADDQKFIDLAWAWPARWLISRDRALLKLARPALARGLQIVTPERWAALNSLA